MALDMRTKRLNTSFDVVNFLERRSIYPEARQKDLVLRQRVADASDLYWRDLKGHFGCVNAIEFSHGQGELIASGGDDKRILVWNVEKALSDVGQPAAMNGEHNSNIFCIAFDIDNTIVFSGGNDEQVIVHDIQTGVTKDVFKHEDAVYGLSVDPNNPHVFASACDDGRVLIYDIRESTADPFCLADYSTPMHAVMYNPVEPRLLATANAKEGIGLWDVRHPRSCILRYGGSFVQQSCMSVRFNSQGDQLIALRRRLPPVLYKLHSHLPICEFDHSGYYNSCTMKSICYAGDRDQYVLSGSDEFNLYMWAIPDDLTERQYISSAHMVLKGHRSIVNQVRFNPANHLILSSGVEKIIKVWSPYQLPAKDTKVTKASYQERPVYTHEEYINISIQNGPVMSHDYTQESTEEDQRMMAFFDSLVQRELESVSSDDTLSSNEEELYSRIVQLSRSDLEMSDPAEEDTEQASSDDDVPFSPFTIAFASYMASQNAEGNDRFPRLHGVPNSSETAQAESQVVAADSSQEATSSTSDKRPVRKAISDLVEKRKKEMREEFEASLKRKRSHTQANPRVSDSDSSDSGPDKDTSKDIRPGSKSSKQKQMTHLKLKRLKVLRNMAMNSDSDISDTEVKAGPSNESTASTTKSSECKTKGRISPDLGPYLHEQSAPTPGSSSHSHLDGPSTSAVSEKGRKTSTGFDGKVSTESKLKDFKNQPSNSYTAIKCESCVNSVDKKSKKKEHKDSRQPQANQCNKSRSSNHPQSSEPCAGTSSSGSTSGAGSQSTAADSQPTWTEFKRYKHKLERARRHYRKRGSSDKNQTDEEDL